MPVRARAAPGTARHRMAGFEFCCALESEHPRLHTHHESMTLWPLGGPEACGFDMTSHFAISYLDTILPTRSKNYAS